MKILTQIRLYLVISLLAFLCLVIKYINQKDELLKCQTDKGFVEGGDIQKAELIQTIDSLKNEMFIMEIELNRGEVAYNIFLKRNPKAAEQYGTIISDETE